MNIARWMTWPPTGPLVMSLMRGYLMPRSIGGRVEPPQEARGLVEEVPGETHVLHVPVLDPLHRYTVERIDDGARIGQQDRGMSRDDELGLSRHHLQQHGE